MGSSRPFSVNDCPCPYCDPSSDIEPALDARYQPYLPFQFPPDPLSEALKAAYVPYLQNLFARRPELFRAEA